MSHTECEHVCLCVCVCAFSLGDDVLVQEQACFSLEIKYLPDNSIFTRAQPARQGHNTHPQIHTYLHTRLYLWAHTLKSHIPQSSLGREKIAVCGNVNHSAKGILPFITKLLILQGKQQFVAKVTLFQREKHHCNAKLIILQRENCHLWQS